jgi:nucleotide-binding universal stress UspA family protein
MAAEEVREAANIRLAEATKGLATKYPSITITNDVVYGNLTDVLDDVADGKPMPILTVIGNSDSDGADSWMSNESSDIMREGSHLTLAVPHDSQFHLPQHVCIACDARTVREGLPLTSLFTLQQMLSFKITVLHVIGTGEEETIAYEGSALEGQLNGVPTGYAEVSSAGPVDDAIAAFADAHSIDWLALSPHHYGFWSGLFHKSHTSRLLHLAHVPVLALHA